jgi:hypothetical protein
LDKDFSEGYLDDDEECSEDEMDSTDADEKRKLWLKAVKCLEKAKIKLKLPVMDELKFTVSFIHTNKIHNPLYFLFISY